MQSLYGPLSKDAREILNWTRLWIMQEIVLARNLTLRCEGFRVDATALNQSSRLLWPKFHESVGTGSIAIILPILDNDSCKAYAGIFCLEQRHLFAKQRGQPLHLYTAMSLLPQHQCRVSHDKVFRLLGWTNTAVVPNYTMVFTEIVCPSGSRSAL